METSDSLFFFCKEIFFMPCVLVLTGVLAASSSLSAFAAAAPDGHTDASQTPAASFRVAADAAMTQNVQEQTIAGQTAVVDSEGTQYYSCKAIASNLKPGTYYYQIGNQETTKFEVQDSSDGFSFIYVGDHDADNANYTYRTDNGEAIDDSFTIKKTEESTLPFTDVNKSDWFYDAVEYTYQNKLFAGINATAFAPNMPMSRAMLVQVLYNMAGQPEVTGTTPFQDVGNAWYKNAVTWASQNGLVFGTSKNTFSPERDVTREQTAIILQRYMKTIGKDTSASADLSQYPDAASVSPWAQDAMQWAVGSGLIAGVKNGSMEG